VNEPLTADELAGIPPDPPRRMTTLLRYAPLVSSGAMQTCWGLLAFIFWILCIPPLFGREHWGPAVQVACTILGVVWVLLALVALVNGFLRVQRKLSLVRNGRLATGRVSDFGRYTTFLAPGYPPDKVEYELSFTDDDGQERTCSMRLACSVHASPLDRLFESDINPESILLFYDSEGAVPLIETGCRFDASGCARPLSTLHIKLGFVLPAMAAISGMAYGLLTVLA